MPENMRSASFWSAATMAVVVAVSWPAQAEPGDAGATAGASSSEQGSRLSDQEVLTRSNAKMQELEARRAARMAQDSMDPATREAWNRYNSNTYGSDAAGEAARKRDFLRLQRDWDQVQAEAHKGNITPKENSRFLREHAADIKQRMVAAGKQNDLGVSLQTPSGPQKTYSDVDGHGRPVYRNADKSVGRKGEMTVEQFERARTDFNEQFNRDLQAAGLEQVDNPSRAMRSDIMPITEDKRLFRDVEGVINPDGGVMYQDPRAVDQEVKNRMKNPDGSVVGDTTDAKTKAAYLQEQIRQQRGHAMESRHMMDEAHEILNNPNATDVERRRANRLLEQAQGEGSSLIGKYEERANRVNEQSRRQAPGEIESTPISDKRQAAIDAVGSQRDHNVTQESAEIMATSENAIKNQQRDGVRNMMAEGDVKAAAEIARNADANTRGQIIEEVRATSQQRWEDKIRAEGRVTDPVEIRERASKLADAEARNLATEMRRNSTPDTFDAENNRWRVNSKMDVPTTRERITEGMGTAMEGVDIFNAAQDVVDYNEGKMSGGQLAESLGGRVPIAGDAYGAGKAIGQKAKDLNDALPAVEGANQAVRRSWAQEAAVDARYSGASKEEAIAIREALSAGDLAEARRLQESLNQRGVDFSIPRAPDSYSVEPDEGYAVDGGVITGAPRRTLEVVEGIADSAVRAGEFVVNTGKNIGEIGSAASETVDANIQVVVAADEQRRQAVSLRDKLADRGVDPARVDEIVDAFERGDNAPLRDLNRELRRQAAADKAAADRQAEAPRAADEAPSLSDQFLSAGDDDPSTDFPLPGADEFGASFTSAAASSQDAAADTGVMTLPPDAVEVANIDDDIRWQREQTRTAEQDLRRAADQAAADRNIRRTDEIRAADQADGAQSQRNQQAVQAAQQQGNTMLQAAANRPDPRMSDNDFNTRMSDLQREQDKLETDRTQILTSPGAGPANASPPLDVNQGGQYGGAAIAAAAAGNEAGFDVRQAKCDDVVKAAGGNNPASVTVNLGGFGGSVAFTFDHYGVKDRVAIISGGGVLFDSGCANYTGGTTLTVPATGQVKVVVEPNCAQTSNSRWEFKVACPAGVAAK